MKNSVTATYGHGTENDFLLIFDPDDKIAISSDVVKALCDRVLGIGIQMDLLPKCVGMGFA